MTTEQFPTDAIQHCVSNERDFGDDGIAEDAKAQLDALLDALKEVQTIPPIISETPVAYDGDDVKRIYLVEVSLLQPSVSDILVNNKGDTNGN